MDDILAKKNRHLFLEEKDNQNNSFIGNINDVASRKTELDTVAAHITNVDIVGDHIDNVDTVANNISDINDAVDNIATVKTFNDNVNNGTMQYLLEAFTTSLNAQGNAWEVRLTQLGESILATTSAFNYSTVVTVSSDIPANGTLILPNSMKYKVGTHMLMVSWNSTVCYAGEQYDEVGAYGVWATSIKLNQPAKAGDKIQLRIVALTDQSSYVDITEAAINASQFVASGSNTERYLPEFLGDVVNVKNFGAIGNGVNDDTTAFQSAIASGKAVFVPEGIYKLNTDLSGVFCGVGNSTFTGGTINGSTILRGIAYKNSDIINVKDFGAKGDGETNDTAAFIAAETAAAGKVVFVPQGSYNVDASELAGIYVSDGHVNAKKLHVLNLPDFATANTAFSKAAGLSSPIWITRSKGFPNIPQSTYYAQSICYDSKRELFYLGQCNVNNENAGYIHSFSDIKNPSTLVDSVSVSGGHFNCMDYDADNDKVYIAPGSTYSNSVLVYNPETQLLETPITISSNAWKLAVGNDGFLYVLGNSGIERYALTNNQKDDGFFISFKAPSILSGESIAGQGCFIFDGIFVIMHNVSRSTPISGYQRVVYNCYDLKTGINRVFEHSVSGTTEVEDAIEVNGVVYAIGSGRDIITVFEYLVNGLDSIKKQRHRITSSVQRDFNDYITEGEYEIEDSTVIANALNAPEVNSYVTGCGKLIVEYVCSTDNIRQTIKVQSYPEWVRIGTIETGSSSINWSEWRNAFRGQYAGFTSCNAINAPGVTVNYGTLTDVPGAANGMFLLLDSRNGITGFRFAKELFFRWGTLGDTDCQMKIRTGGGIPGDTNNPFSWYDWTKIITEKDRFNNNFTPEDDNVWVLGNSGRRWNVVYAGTGSINTSDERLKDNIEEVPDSLMRAWGKVDFKKFQFKDAIQEKGENARVHVGIIAQQVQDAFASEGLDANRYGLFCYDKWDDEYEEDTVIDEEAVFEDGVEVIPAKTHVERKQIQVAGDRYSVRYEECLALECAYQRWLGKQRDAKIEALMQRISALENNH